MKNYRTISMKTYQPIKVEGKVFYENIKSMEFTPLKEIGGIELAVPRGKLYYWKLFGLIPLIPLRAKHNLYKDECPLRLCRFTTVKNALFNLYHFWEDDWVVRIGYKIYYKARVDVYCNNAYNNMHAKFNTNEDAMKYFEDLKMKCEKCGNYLK